MSKFQARVMLFSIHDPPEVATWDDELEPGEGRRRTAEWAEEHLQNMTDVDFRDMFELPHEGSFEIVFHGDIHGHYDEWSGEWDEEFDVLWDAKQALPPEPKTEKYYGG